MIKGFRDLQVYQESYELAVIANKALLKLPSFEKFDLVSQMRRASKSIPANIAEGFAKRSSELEFKRFLKIAIGSSDELISHLRTVAIAVSRLHEEAKELAEEYKTLSKRLNKLQSIWRSGSF